MDYKDPYEFPNLVLDIIGGPAIALFFGFLFWVEGKYQLRKRVQWRLIRVIRNVGVGVVALAALRLAFIPAAIWLSVANQEWQIGINYLYELPVWIEFIIGFLLLDYFNYAWHIVNHRVNLFWRFHHVHHTDLDLDVTTAIRFHYGELLWSIIFRGGAIVLVGASPLLVLVYEIFFELATGFHHSNWKLPYKTEKALNKIIVTPRMHGIHHSIVRKETDSNFSVIFSFWDRIHRTILLNVPQQEIIIGIPSFRDPHELTVWYLLTLPFKKIRKWELPDGSRPHRMRTDDEGELER